MCSNLGNHDDDADPFDTFGHGIQSYFRMIESMICTFFVANILIAPLAYVYYNGGAYEDNPIDWKLAHMSLGNIGHAEPECKH